jgi:hypothetical protein
VQSKKSNLAIITKGKSVFYIANGYTREEMSYEGGLALIYEPT